MRENKKDRDPLIILKQVIIIFSNIINCITERSDHFNEIKKLISYIYEVKNWSILRLDDTTNQLFFTILESEAGDVLRQIPVKVGEGICGKVAESGKVKIITKIEEKKHTFTKSIDNITHFTTQSIIAVPILYSQKVVGVLELINVKDPEIFNRDQGQLHLLQTIANFIGVINSGGFNDTDNRSANLLSNISVITKGVIVNLISLVLISLISISFSSKFK